MVKKVLAGMAIVIALTAVGLGLQDETVPSLKDIEPFAYCVIAHKGPLSGMSGVIGRLIQEMQTQNLFSAIRGPMVGIYPEDPSQTDPADMSWEVGFIVTAQAEPRAPLVKKVWDHPTVASIVHLGPYEKSGETIGRLTAWMKAGGCVADGPLLERYLNNPMQVKPEELRTEIWIPCAKK
jgi:effector-binding domain-containing protein